LHIYIPAVPVDTEILLVALLVIGLCCITARTSPSPGR